MKKMVATFAVLWLMAVPAWAISRCSASWFSTLATAPVSGAGGGGGAAAAQVSLVVLDAQDDSAVNAAIGLDQKKVALSRESHGLRRGDSIHHEGQRSGRSHLYHQLLASG